MDNIIYLLFGFLIGGIAGFIFGLWYYAKKVHRLITPTELSRETVNSIIAQNPPKGDFIQVNKVEQYLKDNEKNDVSIGEVVEDNI